MGVSAELPIDKFLPEIVKRFTDTNALVIRASAGSGKTTRVPLALLQNSSGLILVLEPRRLAAKFAATRIAQEIGEEVGNKVGYGFRFERKISSNTRLIFFTEGTFLRYLQQNPKLENVSAVILDEFHERHLETDAALAVLDWIQKELNRHLKIVLMSATIEASRFLPYFRSLGVIDIETPIFPLAIKYLDNSPAQAKISLEKKVYQAMLNALEMEGDILVFLPGMREILATKELIEGLANRHGCDLHILHGEMTSQEQSAVMVSEKKRKIILSTNIAESSLTIPGVRLVIDSGLHRMSISSKWSGITSLVTKEISKASAIQRAGRAARTNSGTVFRLYSPQDFVARPDFDKPEILRADLSELLLLLFKLNISLEKLNWFESPGEVEMRAAQARLAALGATNGGKLTVIGEEISRFPLHPRLARALLAAADYGQNAISEMAAYLAQWQGGYREKNLRKRLEGLAGQLTISARPDFCLERALLAGFVDRIGRVRRSNKYELLLASGECLKIGKELHSFFDPACDFWLVLEIGGRGEISKICSLEEEWFYDLDPCPIEEYQEIYFDDGRGKAMQKEEFCIGQIQLSVSEKNIVFAEQSDAKQKLICELIMQKAKKVLDTFLGSEKFAIYRVYESLGLGQKKIDDFKLDQWAYDYCWMRTSWGENEEKELLEAFTCALENFLDPRRQNPLRENLPAMLTLTDRRVLPIHYEQNPWVEGYIQDFYGLKETPSVAQGRLRLTVRLLGPHKRAVQITQDLQSFWRVGYLQMKRELERDYPRHHWADNPEIARPVLLKRMITGR